ncbi:MAG: PDZ domain-containing protein [Clostridia bacterium]|nr:PDZ domain-containing protein [Clostridia bacterium]
MLFKRFLSLILSLAIILTFSVSTFATNLSDIDRKVSEAEAAEKEESGAENGQQSGGFGSRGGFGRGIMPFYSSSEYLYNLFNEIVDLYVNTHLYSFTREEAIDRFFRDLIEEHPEYYKLILNTFLGTMDKYSAFHSASSGYLDPEENLGYGILTETVSEGLLIDDVLSGSPAERAGIVKGDVITEISGVKLEGLGWNAISAMMKRPYLFFCEKNADGKYDDYNPEISFTAVRGDETFKFRLRKEDVFRSELTYAYYEKEGVEYIAISSFLDPATVNGFYDLLSKCSQNGVKKLIIDLRDNGGGALDYALSMAENFVDQNDVMCYFHSRKLEDLEPIISTNGKFSFDSISVLIDGGTASAAELMANILKTKAGAVLVGQTSVGKAIGQSIYTLATGDYITITTYEILDINKQSYNEIGLIPDLEISNVELLYDFPKLEYFNHENYKTIVYGEENEACLALEKRLNMMDLLIDEKVDGIWDDSTKNAVWVMQKRSFLSVADGNLNDETVTYITDAINTFKDYTYYEDSQLDVAMLYHSSLDQARRLIEEKKILAKKSARQIQENRRKLEEQYLSENEP